MNLNPLTWFTKKNNSPSIEIGQQDAQSYAISDSISFDSAMQVSSFYACVSLITTTVAAMPLLCYRIDKKTRAQKQDYDYPLFQLINYNVNRYQTRVEFFESIMLNLCTTGNAFAKIQRNTQQEIISLMPVNTANMSVELLPSGNLRYTEIRADQTEKTHNEKDILHIKIFGNGLTGLSPIQYAAMTLNTAKHLDKRLATTTKNSDKPAGTIKLPEDMAPTEITKFKNNIKNSSDNIILLHHGMEFDSSPLNLKDLQLLESRRYSSEQIAHYFNINPLLIGENSNSTAWGSGVHEINRMFYSQTVRIYLERIEAAFKKHLIPKADQPFIELELDVDSTLLRGDERTRVEVGNAKIQSGQATINEVRLSEGLEPLPGGDKLLVNGGLIDVNQSIENKEQEQ